VTIGIPGTGFIVDVPIQGHFANGYPATVRVIDRKHVEVWTRRGGEHNPYLQYEYTAPIIDPSGIEYFEHEAN
jgi:hypothetical protein